jgi:hypothetical protein
MGEKEDPSGPKPITSRLGFMDGEFEVPDDFDQVDAEEITALFEADNLFPVETKLGG